MNRVTLPALSISLLALFISSMPAFGAEITYGSGKTISTIQGDLINESSGLARGRTNKQLFWTHNDSGDGPRIYAFDRSGKVTAIVTVNGVKNQDWEDMASFSYEGTNYLLIGAVGDNHKRRDSYSLHLVQEPVIGDAKTLVELAVDVHQTINFMYEDGPHNCESVAMDIKDGIIYLVTKEPISSNQPCAVYGITWSKKTNDQVVAKKIATLDIPPATAMDITSDGLRAMVLTYKNAYEFSRAASESWSTAFQRTPQEIPMPHRDQGEAICYGLDGKSLYLTSETKNHQPQPLLMVPVVGNDPRVISDSDIPRNPSRAAK